MFTTTPIFHAPVSHVCPITLLRLKFQKKLGPNYRLNNGYFLSGHLGLTNICLCFCCCKSSHAWFCTLGFLCYWIGSCYCVCLTTVDTKHKPVSVYSTEARVYGTPFVTKLENTYGHHVSLHSHRVK